MQTKTLNLYNQENQAVQDAYAMLIANLHFGGEENKVKTIVVTSCKPGVGKTSVSISLAISMALAGWKVLFIDSDMRRPGDAKRINSETLLGLSDYLVGELELDDILCKTNVPNLTYLSCGKRNSNPIAAICTARFKELIDDSKKKYDFVLFDTPALSTVVDASLVAAQADGTLLIVELGQTTQDSIRPAKEQLEKVNAKILGVILNKVRKKNYRTYFGNFDYFSKKRNFRKRVQNNYGK